MQANSRTTKAVIGAAFLAIIIVGALIVRRITASSGDSPRVVYQLPDTRNSEHRKQLLERITRAQVARTSKTLPAQADDRHESDSSQVNPVADSIETQESNGNSGTQAFDQAEQNGGQSDYDERFDTLMSVTRKMEAILAEAKPINEKLDRILNDWSDNIEDPENLTEDEIRQGQEIKDEVDSMADVLQEFNDRLDALIEEIASAVPGSIRTQSLDAELHELGTMQRVSIDYQYIRSAIGTPPDEYDSHLSNFFESFNHWRR
ncbi:MAG: hypothetical protein OXN17_10560 [Candidatus Poribacteria bacterium]|nr:hypothetical protein [Candidatus Poribacteria bacterium]MDE0505345.1 hypothetical protein [Candidatus Poribacteria bacterium]